MKHFLILGLVAQLFVGGAVQAAQDVKGGHFGVRVSGHGDPAPSALGLNLELRPIPFMVATAGVGSYTGVVNPANWLIAFYNVPMANFAYAFAYSAVWLVTLGNVKLRYRPFIDSAQISYLPSKSVFSYGGGSRFFVPTWLITPTVGVHWAGYESKGHPWGLSESGSHFYYSGGLEVRVRDKGRIGGGFNYCPGLTTGVAKMVCGAYGDLTFGF